MFGGGTRWQIWQVTGGLPNFTTQILTMFCDIYKANKQEFTKVLLAKH